MTKDMKKWYQCLNCGEKIGKGSIKCMKDKSRYCINCKDNHIRVCKSPHIKFIYHGSFLTKDKPINENRLEEF